MAVRRTFAALLFGALVAGIFTLIGAAPATAIIDKDCSDFDTQAQAQNFFLNNDPASDPHLLDADGDGIACETLPCPCSTQTGGGGGGGSTTATIRQHGRVTHVVDGDTVDVRLHTSGLVKRVRMIGIDTPEYSPSECGHERATQTLEQMLPVGQRVVLVSDPTQAMRDRYGRLLRYVVRRDGLDTNRAQLARGMARLYIYDSNPFRRVSTYRDAQAAARNHNRGLWDTCW